MLKHEIRIIVNSFLLVFNVLGLAISFKMHSFLRKFSLNLGFLFPWQFISISFHQKAIRKLAKKTVIHLEHLFGDSVVFSLEDGIVNWSVFARRHKFGLCLLLRYVYDVKDKNDSFC